MSSSENLESLFPSVPGEESANQPGYAMTPSAISKPNMKSPYGQAPSGVGVESSRAALPPASYGRVPGRDGKSKIPTTSNSVNASAPSSSQYGMAPSGLGASGGGPSQQPSKRVGFISDDSSSSPYSSTPGPPSSGLNLPNYGQAPSGMSMLHASAAGEGGSGKRPAGSNEYSVASPISHKSGSGGSRSGGYVKRNYMLLSNLRNDEAKNKYLKSFFDRKFVAKTEEPVSVEIQRVGSATNADAGKDLPPEFHVSVEMFLFDDVLLLGSRKVAGANSSSATSSSSSSSSQRRFGFAERVFLPGAILRLSDPSDASLRRFSLVLDSATAQNRRNLEKVKSQLKQSVQSGFHELDQSLLEPGKVYVIVFPSKELQMQWYQRLRDVLSSLPDDLELEEMPQKPSKKKGGRKHSADPQRVKHQEQHQQQEQKKKSFLGQVKRKMSRASASRPNFSTDGETREGNSTGAGRKGKFLLSKSSAGSVHAGAGAAEAAPAIGNEAWKKVLDKAGLKSEDLSEVDRDRVLVEALSEWTESRAAAPKPSAGGNAHDEPAPPTKLAPKSLRRSSSRAPGTVLQHQKRQSASVSISPAQRSSPRRQAPQISRTSQSISASGDAALQEETKPSSFQEAMKSDMSFLDNVIGADDSAPRKNDTAAAAQSSLSSNRSVSSTSRRSSMPHISSSSPENGAMSSSSTTTAQRQRGATFVLPGVTQSQVKAVRKPSRTPPIVQRTLDTSQSTSPLKPSRVSNPSSTPSSSLPALPEAPAIPSSSAIPDVSMPKRPAPVLSAGVLTESPRGLPSKDIAAEDDSESVSFQPLAAPAVDLEDDEMLDALAGFVKKAVGRRASGGASATDAKVSAAQPPLVLRAPDAPILPSPLLSDDDKDSIVLDLPSSASEVLVAAPPIRGGTLVLGDDDTESDMDLEGTADLALGMGSNNCLLDEMDELDSFLAGAKN